MFVPSPVVPGLWGWGGGQGCLASNCEFPFSPAAPWSKSLRLLLIHGGGDGDGDGVEELG